MADSNRIVFPDEVEEAKAAAGKPADQSTGGDSNSLEEVAEVQPTVMTRNMITVPSNCPPGFKMGPDGVCREVFD